MTGKEKAKELLERINEYDEGKSYDWDLNKLDILLNDIYNLLEDYPEDKPEEE